MALQRTVLTLGARPAADRRRQLPMNALANLQAAGRRIRRDAMTVYFAARDPKTPLPVRLLALGVAAYAFSPIDLIPDFIPVLGYLDDAIVLPLGIVLVIKLTPEEVIEASRARANEASARPVSNAAAAIVVALWVTCAVGFVYWLAGALGT